MVRVHRTRQSFPRRAFGRTTYRWLAALAVLALGIAALGLLAIRRRPRLRLEPVRTANAVGDSACLGCHSNKAPFETTAHRLTMRPPTADAIAGHFSAGRNILHTETPGLYFRMDSSADGFYQELVSGDTTLRRERVAYVAGSGRKGQSFLYWSGDQLFQLPVSYWTALDRWIGSPGRAGIDPRASFNRAVAPRCFECHASWIESVPDPRLLNHFQEKGAILGITCERCHTSGREHVKRERSVFHALVRNPAIVNPARLPRDRKMEVCAQCHGGLGDPILPAFTYVPGRPLDRYVQLIARDPDATVDVHGNQVALLSRSRCFNESQMTCVTCHDVHRPQRDVVELSGRCLTCHQEQSCGLYPTRGHALAGHCVDCHMPLLDSKLVISDLEGKLQTVKGRTHWIRVYKNGEGQ